LALRLSEGLGRTRTVSDGFAGKRISRYHLDNHETDPLTRQQRKRVPGVITDATNILRAVGRVSSALRDATRTATELAAKLNMKSQTAASVDAPG